MSAGRHRGEPAEDEPVTMLAICDGLIEAVKAAVDNAVWGNRAGVRDGRRYVDALESLKAARADLALAGTGNYGE